MEINIQKRVLAKNESDADRNRAFFKEKQVFVLNMMSSPGSGKTETLCRTLEALMSDIRVGVIVGDVCTTNDADRLSVTGAKVTQINTDQFGGIAIWQPISLNRRPGPWGAMTLTCLSLKISATWSVLRNLTLAKMQGPWF